MLNKILQRLILSSVRVRYTTDNWFYRSSEKSINVLGDLMRRTQGKPMLVVGNGPSLNTTPLDQFSCLTSIGMNKIDLIYPRTSWRPSMVVCTNNLVVKQHRSQFRNSEIPVFLAWKCHWFIRSRGSRNLHFYKSAPTNDFSPDAGSWVGSLSSTVTYAALQFAYYLGGNPVILVGVDHSFSTEPESTGIEKFEGRDMDHFDPNYFSDGDYWGLPDLKGNETAYRVARHAFDKAGRKVLDATIGGQLTVFPKISIEQAIELAGTQ